MIAALLAVIAAAQLLAPVLAARAIRARLSRHGRVLSVSVSAFPAVALLWGHAQRVSVRMESFTVTAADLAGLLEQSGSVDRLSVEISALHAGLLTLRDVRLSKVGERLQAGARIEQGDLRAALPVLGSLSAVSDAGGVLELRGSAGALGLSASVTVRVSVSDGRIVVAPAGPLAGLLRFTLFDDPRIHVQALHGGAAPGGIAVAVSAVLS